MAFPTAVVCATDLSGRCDRAMDRAAQLARGWNARLIVVHALETSLELIEARRLRDLPSWHGTADRAQLAISRVRQDLGDQFPDATAVVEEGDPAELVKRACSSHRAGLIVTGVARDELFGRRLLGGTVDALIRQVTVPLLVVRDRPRRPYGRIVVATDFSPASRSALETAAGLFPEADLVPFHAFRVLTGGIADRGRMRGGWRTLVEQDMATFLEAAPLPESLRARLRPVLEEGDAEPLLRAYAADIEVDLVVTGARGQSGALDLILGNTARRLIDGLTCDVLAVRVAG